MPLIMSDPNAYADFPYKVTLSRGQRASYAWDLTVRSVTIKKALADLAKLDKELREAYASETKIELKEEKNNGNYSF